MAAGAGEAPVVLVRWRFLEGLDLWGVLGAPAMVPALKNLDVKEIGWSRHAAAECMLPALMATNRDIA